MKLKLRAQKHLVVAHRAEDSDDWIFTLCRRGIEEVVGQRLKTGQEYLIDFNAQMIEKNDGD